MPAWIVSCALSAHIPQDICSCHCPGLPSLTPREDTAMGVAPLPVHGGQTLRPWGKATPRPWGGCLCRA